MRDYRDYEVEFSRAGEKEGADNCEDLFKAKWYINRYIVNSRRCVSEDLLEATWYIDKYITEFKEGVNEGL